MGNFLALSGIINKTHEEVFRSLTNYANSVGGGVFKDDTLDFDNDNGCIIQEANGNTTIFYPRWYNESDDSSEFISKELNTTVFSLQIYDSDFWMYIMYNDGKVVDQFNPIPDYWDNNVSDEELESWKGNASVVAKYVSFINHVEIEKYLVKWNLDEEESSKAYPTDKYCREEWQFVDFMNKLKLLYPVDDNGNPKGKTYKLWTKELALKMKTENKSSHDSIAKNDNSSKPWWRFW